MPTPTTIYIQAAPGQNLYAILWRGVAAWGEGSWQWSTYDGSSLASFVHPMTPFGNSGRYGISFIPLGDWGIGPDTITVYAATGEPAEGDPVVTIVNYRVDIALPEMLAGLVATVAQCFPDLANAIQQLQTAMVDGLVGVGLAQEQAAAALQTQVTQAQETLASMLATINETQNSDRLVVAEQFAQLQAVLTVVSSATAKLLTSLQALGNVVNS